MQLDRIPARPGAHEIAGTTDPPVGVVPDGDRGDGLAAASPRARLDVRHLLVVIALAASLLGQGERCRVDARFVSPSSTLLAYWEALRVGDADAAEECLSAGEHDLPFPGMLWFLPPTDALTLEDFRSLPVTGGRIMVSYRVRYRPHGAAADHEFAFGNELVRDRGEWRIVRPLGEAAMPQWRSFPRPVDI